MLMAAAVICSHESSLARPATVRTPAYDTNNAFTMHRMMQEQEYSQIPGEHPEYAWVGSVQTPLAFLEHDSIVRLEMQAGAW